jgi:hypothetical protein
MQQSKYRTGKIYAICSNKTDDIYIGSTIYSLPQRFGHHQNNKKNICTSKQIIDCKDAYIVLIENYPCETQQQLLERELYWITNMPTCINKINPVTHKFIST